ncbi:MAG: hypothetical protein AB8G17_18980 [Gammaproteobacteria bacterium]
MFKRKVLLFREDMLKALGKAGVDNLELYPAELTDPTSGDTFSDYKAVNILGLVACADLGKSDWQAPSGSAIIDVDFDSLVIDENKTRGLTLFRLAECVSAIMVHESVVEQLHADGIENLDFVEPKDWIG